MISKISPYLFFPRATYPNGSGMNCVPRSNILSFSRLENEINDFRKRFLSTLDDLLNGQFTLFLVDVTKNFSFWLDVLIVIRTFKTVLTGFGSR